MKRFMLIIMLVMTLVALCSCSQEEPKMTEKSNNGIITESVLKEDIIKEIILEEIKINEITWDNIQVESWS